MTYTVQNATSFAAVISEIVSFASSRGWATGGSSITHPTTGRSWDFSTGTEDLTNYLQLSTAVSGSKICRTWAPKLLGTYPNNPAISLPTKVHLFGNNSPYAAPDTEAYIAAVIEFGFNNYRHVYIGRMVRAGNYTDGDVGSANAHVGTGNAQLDTLGVDQRYLFSAFHTHSRDLISGIDQTGGVLITHADNPTNPFRRFHTTASQFLHGIGSLAGDEVFGGQGDGVLDGLVYRSDVDYGSAQILIPYNLFCSNGADGNEPAIRPLGHVSGPRAVSMRNFQPGQQISISSDNWRVFPEFGKRPERFIPSTVSAGTYRAYEASYYLGVAYKE